MEGNQLDLDAPFISFRRITTLDLDSVAFFNSDLTPALVGNPGTIPFIWEKSPGQPKNTSVAVTDCFLNPVPKLPPGRSLRENGEEWLKSPAPITRSTDVLNEKTNAEEDNEEEAFADAQDAFSSTESFSRDNSKRLTNDPQMKDFVMGRFLPAAQAMAADSHQRNCRKPPRTPVICVENSGDRIVKSRLPLDWYNIAQKKEDVEEEDSDDETCSGSRILSSNGCGLIHRLFLKNRFGILNRTRGKFMPRICNRAQNKVLQIKDENSWEAVYMHKLNHEYLPHKEEDRKLSESNQLTSWGDSQLLDGSSFLNSSASTLSADKHEDSKRESGSWKDWETRYSHEKLQETLDCKSLESESQKREESVVSETSAKIDNDLDKNDESDDGLASKAEKNDRSLALSLPPPPLPTSPSESWLRRTVPSMVSKSPHSHHPSFLGIQLHHKKQVPWTSACDHKPITYEKPSNLLLPRARLSEVAKDA